jgi:hypothetical protein
MVEANFEIETSNKGSDKLRERKDAIKANNLFLGTYIR